MTDGEAELKTNCSEPVPSCYCTPPLAYMAMSSAAGVFFTLMLLQKQIGLHDVLTRNNNWQLLINCVGLVLSICAFHRSGYANRTAADNLERLRQERIENLLSSILSDVQTVQGKAALLFEVRTTYFNLLSRQRDRADVTDKFASAMFEFHSAITKLVGNAATVKFVCIDHGNQLQDEIRSWKDIPDQWDLDSSASPQFLDRMIHYQLPEELNKKAESLADVVVDVWKKYLAASWRNSLAPNNLLKG